MYVHAVTSWNDFNQLRGEWDAVYDADPEANLFLSWQWLSDWLNVYPSPWLVLGVKRDRADSGYLGFLPLRNQMGFDSKHGFFNEITLAGAQYSDYTGLLVRPEDEAEAIKALAKHVRRELYWGHLKFDNLLMSARRRKIFLSAFEASTFVQSPIEYLESGLDHSVCPIVDLPSDWDAYLNSLSANNRQKIRRQLRKVDAQKEYRILLSDAESYDTNLKILLDFWKTKWAPKKGKLTKEIAERNYSMLTRCIANGTLLLPVFYDGERPVAAHAILIDARKQSLLFLITGRDETYTAMPAGYLLHAYCIRQAIEGKFRHYDFCRGNESYKYLFAPRERSLGAVSIRTKSGGNLGGMIDPSWVPTMLKMALDSEEKNKLADAELGYRQILETAPGNALALFRFGRLLFRTGAHSEAKQMLSRSVEIEPEGDNAWFWLARAHQHFREDEAAVQACRKVIALRPQNEEAKSLMLRLLTQKQALS